MEAIGHAGTVLGIACADGVILAAEKRVTSKLLDDEVTATEKLYDVNGHIVAAVAGITADATILIQHARMDCQRYLSTYGEPMPVEQLVEKMCDMKQGYTQHGGLRPFGVSFLWAGWDDSHRLTADEGRSGWQLYCSDPSGNYGGWRAHCIGGNSASAQSILKTDYSDTLTVFGDGKPVVQKEKSPTAGASDATTSTDDKKVVGSGMELALKVLSKTMESTTIAADKVEIAVLTASKQTNVKGDKLVKSKIYQGKDVELLLKHYGYVKREAESAAR